MKYGFTGTRQGMTPAQLGAFARLILDHDNQFNSIEFHHGDCIGSDAQAHHLVNAIASKPVIWIHPPTDEKHRAFCGGLNIKKPLPYLDRNKKIVEEAKVMLATPAESEEQLRSGTWSTIRYAHKQGKKVTLILPTGMVTTYKQFKAKAKDKT
jgi:hypothetical protein